MHNSANNVGGLIQKRQSSILDHFQPVRTAKRAKTDYEEERKESLSEDPCMVEALAGSFRVSCSNDGLDWEARANGLLGKHFGYSSLKSFQREALSAWLAHRDCLVLAATGSGKSLCFQIPALLTGKVVIVISPLISLMHDQCMKLAKHGVSACFLGSGQPDRTIENKAMSGVYSVVYVCPETVLRLIKPLEKLAECRGIALFAIDEVHCVSKWGHDFRPDYRRLFVLRETFTAKRLNFLEHDIPIMALTATATLMVREDILASLSMSKETNVVVTSFFRPNLKFSVKHSRTSSPLSLKRDFRELVETYTRKRKTNMSSSQGFDDAPGILLEANDVAGDEFSDLENDDSDGEDKPYSKKQNGLRISKENEFDVFHDVLDWDVSFGEFCAQDPPLNHNVIGSSKPLNPPNAHEESSELGPTIIYVPTRKQTLKIAEYLCECGVKAAAYHAALPKSHLRQVHKEFHEETIEVVVATIAFGMGIDKLNVRRIVHYGWPQSLEAYYQEAGRAGRDGKLAHCTLIANLKRTPSLLPSKRSEEQTKQAYKMLSDCFRYGMNNTCCRAKKLVEYFGEETPFEKCQLCDVCITGPPEVQNLKEEASLLLQVIAAYHARDASDLGLYCDGGAIRQQTFGRRPNLRVFVSAIREQSRKFMATDRLWWQGLARIMEDKGLLREGDDKIHVQIRFPAPTKLGLKLLESEEGQDFCVHPQADMLLCNASDTSSRPFSSFSSWKNGWADPEIRCQRLERLRSKQSSPKKPSNRKPRNRKPRVRNG